MSDIYICYLNIPRQDIRFGVWQCDFEKYPEANKDYAVFADDSVNGIHGLSRQSFEHSLSLAVDLLLSKSVEFVKVAGLLNKIKDPKEGLVKLNENLLL